MVLPSRGAALLLAAGMFCSLLFVQPARAAVQTQCQSSGSLSPAQPAKEYIYLGGRLVATEEPGNCSVPPVNTPVITSLSRTPPASAPNVAAPGETFTLMITGNNLTNANGVTFMPVGIIIASNVAASSDGKTVTATVNVSTAAHPGQYEMVVNIATQSNPTNSLPFSIALPGAPSISGTIPPGVQAQGPSAPPLQIKILGSSINASTVAQANGVTCTPISTNCTPVSVDVQNQAVTITLPPSAVAEPGSIELNLANPNPGVAGGFVPSASYIFFVTAPPNSTPNLVPMLSSSTPASFTAGSPNPGSLTVIGSNFVTGSEIVVNGIARGTVPTIQLTAADVAHPGSLRVSVFTPAPGGGMSNTISVPIVPPSSYYALTLNGQSWVDIGNNPVLNLNQGNGSFTIEAWVKTTAGVDQGIIDRFNPNAAKGSNDGGYSLRMLGSGKVRFLTLQDGSTKGTDTITSPPTSLSVNDGNWHHIAGVFAASASGPGGPGQMTLYIDGQQVATSAGSFTARSPQPGTHDLLIGQKSEGGGPFTGEIDGVRVSSAAVYTANFDPTQQAVQIPVATPGTTAGLWTFDNQTLNDTANAAGTLNSTAFGSPQFLKNGPGSPPTANSLYLQDGHSWVLVPSDPSMDVTGAFTIEAWIKPTATASQQAIVERYSVTPGTGGGFALDLLNGGTVSFSVFRNSVSFDSVTSTTAISANVWHHVAGVYDGTSINIYIDGSSAGSFSGSGTIKAPHTSTADLLIGASENRGVDGTSGFFTGNIDEVRLSSGPLYTGTGPGLPNIPTSLTVSAQSLALWKFDDVTARDSANHNDGILKKHVLFSSDVPGTAATLFIVADEGSTSGAELLGLSQPFATQGDPQFSLAIPGSNLSAVSVVITPPTTQSSTPLSASVAPSSASQVNLTVGAVSPNTPPGAYLITLYDAQGNPLGSTVFNVNSPVPNPVPALATINPLFPSSVAAGSAGFQLQVSGSNFINGSVVQVNNSARATQFSSAALLTAQILSTDVAVPGSLQITVFTPSTGGGGGGTTSPAILTVIGPANNPAPVVTSILPPSWQTTTGPVALRVLGQNFVNGSQIIFNGRLRTDTSFIGAGELDVTLSNSDIANPGTQPLSVPVAVSTPAPGGGLSAPSAFTITPINPVPAVTSLVVNGASPNVIAGGNSFTLTVNGANFVSGAGASVVRVNSLPRSTFFVSSSQLNVTVLAADISAPGSVVIDVLTPAPGGGLSNPVSLTINAASNPLPVLTSLSLTSVPVDSSGQTLVLAGSGFISNSQVLVNETPRSTTFVSSDPTHLSAQLNTSDFAALGTLVVRVFNPEPGGGQSAGINISVFAPVPTLTSITPNSITAGTGQTTITLTGTNFIDESLTQFNGSTRGSALSSPTQITMTLTANDTAVGAQVPITVLNPAPGGGSTLPITFTINNPQPMLDPNTPLTPSIVLAGGGAQTITVLGTGFVPNSTVTINGSNRATFVDPTHLSVALQASDIASGRTIPINVLNPTPAGGISTAANLTVNNPIPTLDPNTPLTPSIVLAGSGAQYITVLGAGFVPTSTVTINGSNRATFVDPAHLTVSIQSSDVAAAGLISIAVFNPGPGGGTSTPAASLMVNNPVPTVAGLSRVTATTGVAPFQLSVLGTDFVGNSTVQFKGVDHVPLAGSNSGNLIIQLTTADLSMAGTFPVTVTNPAPGGGVSSTPATFTISDPPPSPPIVTNISPNSATIGQVPPGTLTITGNNFIVPGSLVLINGVAHTPVSTPPPTANTLVIQLSQDPDLNATAGVYAVTVVTPAGAVSAVNSPVTDFILNNPVPITQTLTPASVPAGSGAQTITVQGTGFVPASAVMVNGQNRATFVDSTHLKVSILSSETAAGGQIPITVVNSAPGGGSASITFSVNNPAPATTALAPSSVTAGSAGFTLTVNGSGFVSGSVVRVNGNNRTTTFVSSTQLTAAIPASDVVTAGTLPITVFNPAPGGGSSSALTVTVRSSNNPLPSISSISPINVFSGGPGFTLTVNGSGFVSNSVINIGAGNNFGPRTTTFVSSTQLTVQITSNDIAMSGTQISVSVANPAPGGGTSNQVTLNVQ